MLDILVMPEKCWRNTSLESYMKKTEQDLRIREQRHGELGQPILKKKGDNSVIYKFGVSNHFVSALRLPG